MPKRISLATTMAIEPKRTFPAASAARAAAERIWPMFGAIRHRRKVEENVGADRTVRVGFELVKMREDLGERGVAGAVRHDPAKLRVDAIGHRHAEDAIAPRVARTLA